MSDVATFLARRLLAYLDANGGQLERQPDQGDGLPRALLTFTGAADRARCRTILADAKADPAVWRAVMRGLPQQAEEVIR